MSSTKYRITEHVIPGQHIREYPNGTREIQEEVLKLSIKQYTPLDASQITHDDQNAVTIIGAHANGFGKEIYEPLWDDLHDATQKYSIKIRSIWIADMSHQGASGVLNENTQGDDTSWFDHSRDLLQMINHFRSEMRRPMVGIGHSMGCAQLVNLSIMHPRLLASLVLIEPVIQAEPPKGPNAAMMATFRPDFWPNRKAAAESFRKNRAFQAWDPRAMDKYLTYCLREVPTAIYPKVGDSNASSSSTAVTLMTTKHQEAWSYVRAGFHPLSTSESVSRLLVPDLDSAQATHLSHRAETATTLRNLPFLRPSVLWVSGERSTINNPLLQEEKLSVTGTGVGGSGGVASRKVESIIVKNASHLVACEQPGKCAGVAAKWMNSQLKIWREEEQFLKNYPSMKSKDGKMLEVSREWKAMVRKPTSEKRLAREGKL